MTTIETVEQLDEMRAKTLCESFGSPLTVGSGDDLRENWRGYLVYAKAIREADERAGLAVVPKVPTHEMANATGFALNLGVMEFFYGYQAMLAASPFTPKATP